MDNPGSIDPEREWVHHHVQPSDFEIQRGPIGLRQSRIRRRGMMRGWFKNGFGGEENTTKQTMTIQERAAKVLQEIDAELALAEKATPGPWIAPNRFATNIIADASLNFGKQICDCADSSPECKQFENDVPFIAASRTGWPASLRCLKITIEWALVMAANGQVGEGLLTTLCNKWDSK